MCIRFVRFQFTPPLALYSHVRPYVTAAGRRCAGPGATPARATRTMGRCTATSEQENGRAPPLPALTRLGITCPSTFLGDTPSTYGTFICGSISSGVTATRYNL